MNILLLQKDAEVRARVVFALESQFNASVLEAGSPEEAQSILKEKGADLHLLVVDCERSRAKEIDKLRAQYSKLQAIVFYQGAAEKPQAISAPPGQIAPVYIDRGDILNNLTAAIQAMVKQSAVPSPEDDRNFCKIRTKLLLSVCPLESDIYIRLSESKYLKLFQQGDNFDLQDMEKYTTKKGVEYLYLQKSHIQDFIKKYQAELASYLERKPEMAMEEVAKVNGDVFDTIQSLGGSLGFTPQVQEMAKTQVQLTMQAMGKSPKLSRIFDQIKNFKGQYIASHSTLCGYIACAIASQMKWGSDTTFHKLTLAAFIHDISLTNHDLAACGALSEVDKGKFTDEEKKAFRAHPQKAAELAKQMSEVPPDVDVIIAQHHEKPDGTGFPRGLASNYIAPLAAVFIVAHDVTQFALKKESEFNIKDFLKEARDRYKPSQFRKVIQAIEQLEIAI